MGSCSLALSPSPAPNPSCVIQGQVLLRPLPLCEPGSPCHYSPGLEEKLAEIKKWLPVDGSWGEVIFFSFKSEQLL